MSQFAQNVQHAIQAGAPAHVIAQMHQQRKRYENRKAVTALPYYSMIRLGTTRSGAGPYTYTGDTTVKKAFSYKIGDNLSVAGFASGTATESETNLLKASETRDAADVLIWGFSISIAQADPKLLEQFFRVCSVSMSLSGTDTYTLGRLEFFPQTGGLYGSQRSRLQAGALHEAGGEVQSFMSNGNPQANSFFKLPEAFLWEGTGNGKDSSLAVMVKPQSAIAVSCTERSAVAGAAPGASGQIEAFAAPADGAIGSYADICVRLHSVAYSPSSPNV